MKRSLLLDHTSAAAPSASVRADQRSANAFLSARAASLALATLAACAEAEPSSSRDPAREPRAIVAAYAQESDGHDQPSGGPDGEASSEPSDRDQQATGSSASAIPAEELRAAIRSVSFTGELCEPADGHLVDLSPYGFATVGFEKSFAAGVGGPAVSTCSIAIELEVPEGMQLSAAAVLWGGGSEPGVTMVERYGYEGETPSAPVRSDLTTSGFLLSSQPEIWSPTCSGRRRATFTAALEIRVPESEVVALHSFTFSTEWAKGVAWRACDGAAAMKPTSQLGQSCGGPQQIECAPGLVCQHDSRGTSTSLCVDPSQQLAPGKSGETCGGVSQRTCLPGLACWWPSESAAANGVLGRCTPPALGIGGQCELGVPALPCEAGLFCKLKSHRCVVANGALESECGDGLPPCDDGLVCSVSTWNGFASGLCTDPDPGCSASNLCDEESDQPEQTDETEQTEQTEESDEDEQNTQDEQMGEPNAQTKQSESAHAEARVIVEQR